MDFVGRADELLVLGRWVLDEHCRVLAVLGIGGVGKANPAARLAQDVAPSFERVYWRSLRSAPALSEWLAGAIAFVSDQQLAPPAGESERVGMLLRLLTTAANSATRCAANETPLSNFWTIGRA